MDIKELRKMNDESVALMREYREIAMLPAKRERANICFTRSMYLLGEIVRYNDLLKINAMNLADAIRTQLEKETGDTFIPNIKLKDVKSEKKKDEFGLSELRTYSYSLELKNTQTGEVIEIANNSSSIMANNEKFFEFNEQEAYDSFKRKYVNLLHENDIRLPNANLPVASPVVEKYNLEDCIWSALEKEHARVNTKSTNALSR